MPTYSYTAKSFKGETVSGTQEAENKHQLSSILRSQGLVLVEASLKKEEKKRMDISISFLKKVSLTEKMMFTRNLAMMIGAGIPLPRALNILSLQAKSKKLKRALMDIREEVIKGKSFSEALEKFPDIFPELFSSMIKVGEKAGTLEQVLRSLTQHMEREHELKSRIMGALMYPIVIIFAMLGIGALMLVMVVPKMAKTFEDLGIELPATTKFVIGLGTFLAEKWYLAILIVIALVFLLRAVLKTKTGKKVADSLVLKIPIISNLVKKTNAAYTIRTLSSLIVSGVPIVHALEIISGALGNFYFKRAVADCAKKVEKGAKLSQSLKPYQNLYPLLVVQMIEVGEETGQTSDILAKLADFFEEEVANTTKNLSSLLEPVIMLLIGGAVGFFAIAMIQPMYSMLGAM